LFVQQSAPLCVVPFSGRVYVPRRSVCGRRWLSLCFTSDPLLSPAFFSSPSLTLFSKFLPFHITNGFPWPPPGPGFSAPSLVFFVFRGDSSFPSPTFHMLSRPCRRFYKETLLNGKRTLRVVVLYDVFYGCFYFPGRPTRAIPTIFSLKSLERYTRPPARAFSQLFFLCPLLSDCANF